MTVRLQASLQSLVFVVLLAATLFSGAGRINFIEFWLYIAVVAAASGLALADLDPDLMQERMRPGGRRVGLRFLPMVALMFLHWAVAGIDRGRPHASDTVPALLEGMALVLFGFAWVVFLWAMHVNGFFSSIPRIQSERGHVVITTGPYRFVRHPGYTAALVVAVTSGIALGSWISTFIAPVAVVLLVRRTIFEDRMLQRDLSGYAEYASPLPPGAQDLVTICGLLGRDLPSGAYVLFLIYRVSAIDPHQSTVSPLSS